jgi:hypothetical protein
MKHQLKIDLIKRHSMARRCILIEEEEEEGGKKCVIS